MQKNKVLDLVNTMVYFGFKLRPQMSPFKPGSVFNPFIILLWAMFAACNEKQAATDLSSLGKNPNGLCGGICHLQGTRFLSVGNRTQPAK